MDRYVCFKEVNAAKIKAIEISPENGDINKPFIHTLILENKDGSLERKVVTLEWIQNRKPETGGYFVDYGPEGRDYTSYSPSDVFEKGYALKEPSTSDYKTS